MTSSTKDDAETGAKPVAAATSGACEIKENPPLLWTESWRPIESAPKDGTVILGAGFPYGPPVRTMEWSNGQYLGRSKGYEQTWTDRPGSPCQPTHWMPLPPPPGSEVDAESLGREMFGALSELLEASMTNPEDMMAHEYEAVMQAAVARAGVAVAKARAALSLSRSGR
jgi:hypothetical protein